MKEMSHHIQINTKMKTFTEFLKESIENITYEVDDDDDYTQIDASIKGEVVATLVMEKKYKDDEYFDDIRNRESFLFKKDEIIDMQHLKTKSLYMNKGIGKELIRRGIDLMVSRGFNQFYLNASPMTYEGGLNVAQLVKFYESFGFEKIWDQGNNVQMAMIV